MTNQVIGVDIGGTKIYVGLVDKKSGEVLDYIHFLKGDMSDEQVLQNINKYIAYFHDKYQQKFDVGIAVPELVNNQGRICSHFTYDWIGKENQFIAQKITFESDVRAAALAELTFGVAQGHSSSIYISLGTGVSYSFIQNGTIWRGHKGHAIHFATSPLFFPQQNNLFAHIPQSLIYEDFIAGKGFNQETKQLLGQDIDSRQWLQKLKNKDEASLHIAQNHAKYFGGLLAQLINILDPEQIVIGGGFGMALKSSPYMDLLKNEVVGHIIADDSKDILFSWAHHNNFSALVGAALST
ncbi:MAG: ROK family protein [Alphaproteobacteria bacterium]